MQDLEEMVVFGEWNKSFTVFGFIICPKNVLEIWLIVLNAN